MYTALDGYYKCVAVLVLAGADVNTGSSGNTALMAAALNGHDECVDFLIQTGADVNIKDANGRTAVMYAARYAKCIDILVRAGADVNVRSTEGETALMLATENSRFSHCYMSISRLLKAGANVNVIDRYGNTVCHMVAVRSDSDSKMIKMVLAAGARINVKNNGGLMP